MKNNYKSLALTLLMSAMLVTKVYSQCLGGVNFGSATLGGFQATFLNITTCAFGGERSVLTVNFLAGVYNFNGTGGGGNYLTLYNSSNQVVAHGPAPLTNITFTATGTYYLQVNTNSTCGTDNACHTLQWQCLNLPCVGTPAAANSVSGSSLVCLGAFTSLSLSTTYTNTGSLTIQWESSTTGPNGTYANVPGGITNAISSPTLGTNTSFRAIITCTNGGVFTTTTTPVDVSVGAPAVSNAVTNLTLVCPGMTSSLSLSSSYVGVSYSWEHATQSSVGPYTVVPAGTTAVTSGTTANFVSGALNVPTYFRAILSCSAATSFSTIVNYAFVNVAGTTTSSVPYHEGFEGVGVNNFMPNCSWSASSPTTICQTYTVAAANNRIPNDGSKFASFKSSTAANGDYFYSNGIQLEPGVTYSASVWYITDGALGWTEFSLLYGTSQSTTGLTNIASVNSPIIANTAYKSLSGTFTVASSGLYFLGIKCKGSASNFFTFDDLRITIPCSVNSPSLSSTIPSVACSGQAILCSATGADTYFWVNNSASTANTNISLNGSSNITVVGTNSASGCSSTVSALVNVLPSPPISVSATDNATFVCKGSSILLNATGAGVGGQYSWTTGTTGISISVSPTVATSYTVTGTNQNNCSASAPINLAVKDAPTVQAIASSTIICAGENVTLTATGADTYTWSSNNSFVLGVQAVLAPSYGTLYNLEGSNSSGCHAKATTSISVSPCIGINEINGTLNNTQLYPNPNNGQFTLEFTNENEKVIEVLDLTGRLVLTTKSNGNKTEINMSEFSAGVYYVRIKEGNATHILKAVKQ